MESGHDMHVRLLSLAQGAGSLGTLLAEPGAFAQGLCAQVIDKDHELVAQELAPLVRKIAARRQARSANALALHRRVNADAHHGSMAPPQRGLGVQAQTTHHPPFALGHQSQSARCC